MMEALPDGGKLAIMSIINADNMREGVKGFTDYIAANGGGKYEIVANEDDNGDSAKAAEVTAALLAAHPDIAGFAGFDSESGAGIVRALQEAGKQPGDIKVTAMEQTPDFFKTAAGRLDEGDHRAEPRAVHLLRDQDAVRLQPQRPEDLRPRRRRRRRADAAVDRHRRPAS